MILPHAMMWRFPEVVLMDSSVDLRGFWFQVWLVRGRLMVRLLLRLPHCRSIRVHIQRCDYRLSGLLRRRRRRAHRGRAER